VRAISGACQLGVAMTKGRRTSRIAIAALIGGMLAVRRLLTAAPASRSHLSQRAQDYETAAHRILILGGGFGGVTTALGLDRRLRGRDDVSVLMVDRDSALLFTPLLWTVAEGRSDPSDVVVPIRAFQRRRRLHLLHAEVNRIDLDRREVETTAGARSYDVLVIALGSVTAVPDLPGLREHARIFHSPIDAMELRNHLIEAVEAAHQTDDAAERQAWLTFVVGGGGDTGVELAATIRTYLATGLLAAYPWLTETPPHIVLVGRADRLIPMSEPVTSDAVRRVLEEQGVEVLTGVAIEGVTDRSVRTSRGEIPTRTLFWAVGITAPQVVRELPLEHAANGAVVVNDHLRPATYPDVYVVGDAAWAFDAVNHAPVPPTAQAAEHEGRYVAATIAAGLTGQEAPPFRYHPRGHLALLGHDTGVARVGPLTFTGRLAWLLWHGYYLNHIPSVRNRLRLAADWLLSSVSGRETAQLPLGRVPAVTESR
jgi:NADH:ubiquinone reductase (H+-translocating)